MWVRTRKFSNQNAHLKIKNKTKLKLKKKLLRFLNLQSFFFFKTGSAGARILLKVRMRNSYMLKHLSRAKKVVLRYTCIYFMISK